MFRILELLFYELFSRIVNRILGIISHWVRIFRIRTCTRNVLFFFVFVFFFLLNVDFFNWICKKDLCNAQMNIYFFYIDICAIQIN